MNHFLHCSSILVAAAEDFEWLDVFGFFHQCSGISRILWESISKKLLHTSFDWSLLDWREVLCYFNNNRVAFPLYRIISSLDDCFNGQHGSHSLEIIENLIDIRGNWRITLQNKKNLKSSTWEDENWYFILPCHYTMKKIKVSTYYSHCTLK